MHSQPNKAPFFCCCPCPPRATCQNEFLVFTCFAFSTKVKYERRQIFTMQNQKKIFRPWGLEAKLEEGGFLSKIRKTKENDFVPTFFYEMIQNQIIQIQMFGIFTKWPFCLINETLSQNYLDQCNDVLHHKIHKLSLLMLILSIYVLVI